MPRPPKPFKTIEQQVILLAQRGMAIEADRATQWLTQVGYYRLSGYAYPYRMPTTSSRGSRQGAFEQGTDFTSVTALYEFDRKLRALAFDALERVEVALRSHLSYEIGSIDPFAYRDPSNFRPNFNHAQWLEIVQKRIDRSKRHSDPIRHHDLHYNGDLPIWVLVDVLDFSDVSRAFEGLPSQSQWNIGDGLGLTLDLKSLSKNQQSKAKSNHPLTRWLEQLTIVRNTCAHHSRMWNRSFAPAGTAAFRTVGGLESLPDSQSERLYGSLLVISRLLHTISPGSSWTSKVRTLIIDHLESIPGRSASEMGFPQLWEQQRPWQN